MKCAFINCVNPGLSQTDPYSVCDREVHYLCSNDLHDPGNISVGDAFHEDLLDAFDAAGWSPGTPHQQDSQPSITESETLDLDHFTVCVDSYGIPLDVHHYRQVDKRDNVWDVAHIFATPFAVGDDDDAERFTHICALRTTNATRQPNAAADSWQCGLRRWSHTSNTKDHMAAIHSTHRVGKAEMAKRTMRDRRQIDSSCKVKALITSRIEKFYGISIEGMAQFTMSDTTPSAKKNTETVYIVDPETNLQKKERRVCTLDGPFPEGDALIRKARGLNNHFNTPQRLFFGLPELSPMVDCDTRVASSVIRRQRTIVDFPAFRAYIQHGESYKDSQVFHKFTDVDWRLLVEMEEITSSLADLACIEVQRSNQVASELIVLMKFAFERLGTDNYQLYDVEALCTPKTNE
ncbi:hypothetical protein PInf_013151 [Phytophthora infestans]|nr:hypothetical protein PInf_013151 [Phytophthora infestans]